MKNKFDDIEYKPIKGKLLKRLLVFLKPYKKNVAFAILLTIFISALGPVRPYLNKIAIDSYIANGDLKGLVNLVIIIVIFMFLHGIIQFLLTFIMQQVGQNVLYDIRIKLYKHVLNFSFKFFDKNPVGRLVTRVTNDVEGLNEMFSSGVVMIIADILLICWIIIFMFLTNSQLAMLSLSILPLLFIVTTIFRKKIRIIFRNIRANVAQMNSFINEFLSGIIVIKLFKQNARMNNMFDVVNIQNKYLWVKTIWHYSFFFPTIEMISTIALAILIWYTAGNIITDAMSIGTLIAFLQYSEMFFRPVRDLTEKYTTLQSAMASSERIFGLLDNKEYIIERRTTKPYVEFKDKIEFRNVSFEYEDNRQVIKNVSFEVKKGETVAIVGATGSGKTTLINLFLRYYDFQVGDILIDKVSIKDISIFKHRRRLALVMQDVFLFSRKIDENIKLGRKELQNERLLNTTKALGADSFIQNLSNGYQSEIMERGKILSVGQRQLISFARAYISEPDILILDEATSNIDSESEAIIDKALDKLLENKTSIIIAHRISTIKRADKIIVLHHGHVIEEGTHKSLLKINGVYSKLYKLQFGANLN